MEAEEILNLLDVRYKVVHILLATVTAVVLIWFGYMTRIYCEHMDSVSGYTTVELIVIDRQEEVE